MIQSQIITAAVQKAAAKLLNHFQAQYGTMIFIPLGVNSNTPAKIAPQIAESIIQNLIVEQEGTLFFLCTDQRVGIVFDTFMKSFIDSLNFIAKGVMSALGMKMFWVDFAKKLSEKKVSDPTTYQKWKNNLNLVLETVFTEVINDLNTQGTPLILTDGQHTFETTSQTLSTLNIFQ